MSEIILCDAALRTEPAPNVSKDYSHLPTIEVVESLRSIGYLVSGSNQQGKTDYGVHVVRMRHEAHLDDKLAPEIVIKNANNGYSPLSLMSGLFRMVCSNGLIVGTTSAEFKIVHRKNATMDAVFDGVKWIVDQTNISVEKSKLWEQKKMDYEARAHFTKLVGEMLKGKPDLFNPNDLLKRRYDEEYNLWTVFNLAQESLIKGGINQNNGRVLRGITGAQRNVALNKDLWNLTERFAEVYS